MQLEYLHHFLNSRGDFGFNATWHRQSLAALIFCRGLAISDVAVTPSVACMDWLHWWHKHRVHVVSSSRAFTFANKMSEKCKSTSPSAIQVKHWQKTISTEELLDAISWL